MSCNFVREGCLYDEDLKKEIKDLEQRRKKRYKTRMPIEEEDESSKRNVMDLITMMKVL